ncbi:MAG: ComEA protein [Microgenomates group bacterium GW2011_GWC1_41_8]|uniref:ComEA protein n=1 Tax=Candidatus Roizmanbacteria bacterium GW2011_GWB1_40_7 TaxID=1618482 RepID=A0A0G0VIK2_9BACT|nr:MAG: ComEA protein [Candidatus Roizmanbacteria bacterium GW2011_GWB1_40_7]KKS23465.1 MAG: ComEA protein [Microgenomates group bacterium GW2011_GWC1_41_8]
MLYIRLSWEVFGIVHMIQNLKVCKESTYYVYMYSQYLSQFRIPLILGSVGVICFVIFVIISISDSQKKEQLENGIEIIQKDAVEQNDQAQMIYIDIQGAVVEPGVYEMKQDSRIIDLLDKAGGYDQEADLNWIAKNINQAQKLEDGTKLYIPFKGEQNLGNTSETDSSALSININTASTTELESLNGIGEKRAQQIIDGRPYSSIQELLEKGIVGEKTFEAIKDQIRVY